MERPWPHYYKKSRFEKYHADVLERRRRGYKNPDPLDMLIASEQKKVVGCALIGVLAEDSVRRLSFLILMRARMESEDAKDAVILSIRRAAKASLPLRPRH